MFSSKFADHFAVLKIIVVIAEYNFKAFDPNEVAHHKNENYAISSYGYHRTLNLLIGYNKSDWSAGWESSLDGLILYYNHQNEEILDPKQGTGEIKSLIVIQLLEKINQKRKTTLSK